MTPNGSFRLLFIYSLVFIFFIGTLFSGADLSDPRNNEIELPNQASLIRAIKIGNLDSVKKICKANPDSVFQRDLDRNIALHYAAQSLHEKAFEIVAYLVFDAHSDSCINTRGKFGYTPLDLAYKYGIKNVIDYLKANGAEKNNRSFSADLPIRKLYFNNDDDEATTDDDQEDSEEEDCYNEDEEQDDRATDREDDEVEDRDEGYLSQEYDSEKEY